MFIFNSFKDAGNTLVWRNYLFWEYGFLKLSRRFGWCMKIHASVRKCPLCNIWFSNLRDVYQNISKITNINSQHFLNQGSPDGFRPLFRNFAHPPSGFVLQTPSDKDLFPVWSEEFKRQICVWAGRPLRTKVYRFAVKYFVPHASYPASASVPRPLFWTWTGYRKY